MITSLYILGTWCVLLMIAAPVLLPKLARRFARHDDWIKESSGSHHLSSVTPQIRPLRQRKI